MNLLNGYPLMATGNILVSTFVTIDTSANFSCKQAGVGDIPIGIAQAATLTSPNIVAAISLGAAANTANYAAVAGTELNIWGPADICWITVGSGGCSPGDYLKPDLLGRGITASVGDNVGCRVFQTGSLGDLVTGIVVDRKL